MESRYSLIKASEYLCVAALVENILKAEANVNIDQFTIANYFGVKLPPNKKIENITNYETCENLGELGISIKENQLNKFFKEYKLPFVEEFYSVFQFEDWEFDNKLKESLNDGAHIIFGYYFNDLFKTNQNDLSSHASLLIDITIDKNENDVIIFDPGPLNYGLKTFKSFELYKAIKKRKDGLWIIHREK